MDYKEVKDYWKANPCNGGNPNYPFWLYRGKRVLEIGCGTGNDGERFRKIDAHYTGIDIAPNAPCVVEMNAEAIDFPDNHFDLVYSFGVVHHMVNPEKAIREMYRVLKPRGLIYLMVYNKPSIRYNIDIMFLRKIAWFFHPKFKKFKSQLSKPSRSDWVSLNTDNLGCPISRVYTEKEALNLLKDFNGVDTETHNWGWFRCLHGRK